MQRLEVKMKNLDMNRKKKISIILMIIWMAFIFIMSSFDSAESGSQSNIIVNIIANIFKINNYEVISFIVRKIAHFMEYLILGILVTNVFNVHGKKQYISIIVCIIYAISDEIHQLFVPGRSCQIFDMFIDSLGSSTGTLIFCLIKKLRKNTVDK